MTKNAAITRLLLSRDAAGKHSDDIARVFASTPHALVFPDQAEAALATIAFVSRDVTGLSTKHELQPETRRFYDALRAASVLRWVHIHSAGTDRPIYLELAQRGVAITTSSSSNARVVAQTAVMGLLSLARHGPFLAAAQRRKEWTSLYASGLPRDLGGQTAVVVGWGPAGQEIGRLLGAIGLNLVVVRRSERPAGQGILAVPYAKLHEVLPCADWLLLACPLSEETRRLVGGPEFALLRAHCGVVNVARGEVVDEDALVAALRERRISGAYLDVFAHEPLPAQSPLWDMPNVIVTPHSAGMSDANEGQVARMFLQNLARWVRGEGSPGSQDSSSC
ncbi:MAG: D-2-hydroxyacid dehydrogenase [Burkholderiales bacterium]